MDASSPPAPDATTTAPPPTSGEAASATDSRASSSYIGDVAVATGASEYPSGDDLHRQAASSKITNLKFLNGTSFLLAAIVVVGVAFFGAREEGVYGDEYLWMRYQTLLTPASYAKFILVPILLLHGLFVYASTLNLTLRASPLVGYELALSNPKQSVAVHYPGVCATTIMTVVSHDHGWMGCALLSSVLGGVVLGNILRIQSGILNESGSNTSVCGESSYGVEDGMTMEGGGDNAATTNLKAGAFPYLALRLPFELHAGYSLSSVALYLVAFLDGFDGLPRMVQLIVSNLCIVGLLGVGTWVLWKVPDRKFYGVGLALVWYLLGVAVELREPSQPIYNAFSDAAILTTQVVAWISTTILASVLGVRAMKTAIKYNLFNCMGRLGGADLDASTATQEEDGMATDYVAA